VRKKLAERNGFEPAGTLSDISNLLINHVLLSPPLPLIARIWHWEWH